MERITRGFRLLRASWEVLKADRELMILPVISFLAIAAAAATFFVAAWGISLPAEGESLSFFHYVFMGLFYFVSYFIGIFFNAAVVGAATIRLQGGDPTVRDGIRIAMSKLDKILGWAAIAATVGLIIRSLEERAPLFGRIVLAFVGAAWSAITFFVVPVLLYEPLGVVDSVKRSATLFKQRWGEQFVGNVSIGLAIGILMLPAILLAVVLGAAAPALGIIVGVATVGLLAAAGGAMTGIFNAALYRYATTGQAPGGFSEDDLRGSFRPRGRRGIGGMGGGRGPTGFSGPLN
jgi:uncharacterized protein DUF6159